MADVLDEATAFGCVLVPLREQIDLFDLHKQESASLLDIPQPSNRSTVSC